MCLFMWGAYFGVVAGAYKCIMQFKTCLYSWYLFAVSANSPEFTGVALCKYCTSLVVISNLDLCPGCLTKGCFFDSPISHLIKGML